MADNSPSNIPNNKPKSVIEAVLMVRKKVTTLKKDQNNEYSGYMFVGIDTYYEKVRPLADAVGLVWRPHIIEWNLDQTLGKHGSAIAKVRIDLYLVIDDGPPIPFEDYMTVPIFNALAGAQTTGQVMAYAEKVFMRHAFDVPTGESDGDDTDQRLFSQENKTQPSGGRLGAAGPKPFPTLGPGESFDTKTGEIKAAPVATASTGHSDENPSMAVEGDVKDRKNSDDLPVIDTRSITSKNLAIVAKIFETWMDKPKNKRALRNWYAENVPALEKIKSMDPVLGTEVGMMFTKQAAKLPD